MCYYDQYLSPCGDWKWGNFKSHCSKEYRTGETCGMKLVWESIHVADPCKNCQKIQTKQGKIRKEEERITRWKREGSAKKHSIKAAEESIKDMEDEIRDLHAQRTSVRHSRQYQ